MKCDKGPVDITGLKIVVCFGVKLSNAYLSMRTRDRYYLLVSPVLGGKCMVHLRGIYGIFYLT